VNVQSLTLTAPEMTCGHCEAAVRREVGAVDGVTDIRVDLASKEIVVSGSGLDRDAVVGAIDEAGFDVT
jgi:copper chaperone CopZ